MALLDDYVDNGYEEDITPGFLRNHEEEAEYLLAGLTRAKQNDLIHKTAKKVYGASKKAMEKSLGRKLNPEEELDHYRKSRAFEHMFYNMPENFQDSHLLSMLDTYGNPDMRFVSKDDMSRMLNGRNADAFYSPVTGDIVLPFAPKPVDIFHENTHRNGHRMNPMQKNFSFNTRFLPFSMDVYSVVPDWFGVKNMGRTFQKDFVGKTNEEPMNVMKNDERFSDNMRKAQRLYPGINADDSWKFGDMMVLSPSAYLGKIDRGHGTLYRNEKINKAENSVGLGLTPTGKPTTSFDRTMATQNYPLSTEGSAMYNEMVAKNPRFAKQVSREAFNRLNAMYGADWRKRQLEKFVEKGDTPYFYNDLENRYGASVDDDPKFDTFIIDGKPRMFYSALNNASKVYDVRVQSPYGQVWYGNDLWDVPQMMKDYRVGRFQHRNIDGDWVTADGKTVDPAVREKYGDLVETANDFARQGIKPSTWVKGYFRVKDNYGYHYFNNAVDARRFADRRRNSVLSIERHDGEKWDDVMEKLNNSNRRQ